MHHIFRALLGALLFFSIPLLAASNIIKDYDINGISGELENNV